MALPADTTYKELSGSRSYVQTTDGLTVQPRITRTFKIYSPSGLSLTAEEALNYDTGAPDNIVPKFGDTHDDGDGAWPVIERRATAEGEKAVLVEVIYGDIKVMGGGGVNFLGTELDVTLSTKTRFEDINGNPIGYGAIDMLDASGEVIPPEEGGGKRRKEGIQYVVAQPNLVFTRRTHSPASYIQFVGKVNDAPWQGAGAKQWFIEGMTAHYIGTDADGDWWETTFFVTYDADGHKVEWIDDHDPTDTGSQVRYAEVYQTISFSLLPF